MTDLRAIVAHHEAGHAVIAHMLRLKVRRVSIEPDETSAGRASMRLGRGERAVLVTLAGPYAQRRYAPRSGWRSRSHGGFDSGYDFDIAINLIAAMHGNGKVAKAYWRFAEAKAEHLVEQHWQKTEAVAKALLKGGHHCRRHLGDLPTRWKG